MWSEWHATNERGPTSNQVARRRSDQTARTIPAAAEMPHATHDALPSLAVGAKAYAVALDRVEHVAIRVEAFDEADVVAGRRHPVADHEDVACARPPRQRHRLGSELREH